ncbi:MAG: hypothetical protein VKL39_05440 [Leptolyngbyaceae bacterium]|nr:hypothetical protein [Leptolyngbyaceae bacterium]
MNTPAHAIVNLLLMGRQQGLALQLAIVTGAVLPDLPIFVFYFVEKVLRNTPERMIWTQAYFQEHWQNAIDVFNSLPLMVLGLGISIWGKSNVAIALFISMMLHVAGDLPLHHDDAHRHFLPFSNWRFISPVSYWDPRFHGTLVGRIEMAAVIVSCVVLFITVDSLAARSIVGVIGGAYLVYFIYAIVVWG